jgi:hypothetical protein
VAASGGRLSAGRRRRRGSVPSWRASLCLACPPLLRLSIHRLGAHSRPTVPAAAHPPAAFSPFCHPFLFFLHLPPRCRCRLVSYRPTFSFRVYLFSIIGQAFHSFKAVHHAPLPVACSLQLATCLLSLSRSLLHLTSSDSTTETGIGQISHPKSQSTLFTLRGTQAISPRQLSFISVSASNTTPTRRSLNNSLDLIALYQESHQYIQHVFGRGGPFGNQHV